jgi:hypothetical protein
MRSRLSLYLNELTLEEILYLEEEMGRRKEKYRRNYAVLSVQTDRPLLQLENILDLSRFTQDMRRYISASAAVGGGIMLAYSPEVSVLLFQTVDGASRTCSALLSGLPELNGRYGKPTMRIGVKLGLASGTDTMAAGSPRCVRSSPLVRRANQAAWRSSSNILIMDENSYQEWPEKYSVALVPFEIDGQHLYRAVPGMLGKQNGNYDNESLLKFLRQVSDAGIPTLKYDMERVVDNTGDDHEKLRLLFEVYDMKRGKNLTFSEMIHPEDFSDRIEVVKRMLSSMGLALVRHELSASTGV